MNNDQFCHLHIHNEFSQLDGLGTAENYATCAEELGFEYMALTNHGNIDGIIRWQKACKSHNIKPVFGCEFYIVPDMLIKEPKEKRYHMTILAKNDKGLESIMRMLTIANDKGFYYSARIDPSVLLEQGEEIVIMSACTSTFLWMDKSLWEPIIHQFKDDLYLELMPLIFDYQYKTNEMVIDIGKEYHIKSVATNDCHYPLESGSITQEVLLAMQRKSKWKDKNRWKFEINGLYLRTADEMIEAFKEQGQIDRGSIHKALKNTIEVAEKCTFEIKAKPVFLPKVPGYEKRDESKLMWSLIQQGYKKRCYPDLSDDTEQEYFDRIKEEYDLICELGFQRYFLIVWELISWCKKNDIMTGPGRGSVGGSLVAFCMGITDVDPIKYGLIFARFISPARIDLPDIDMDFEDIKRYRIREHLEDMYGKDHVTSLSTFLTMKGRLAVRDVSRVFDVPIIDVNKASKSIVVRSGGDFRSDFSIEDAFDTFEDGIEFKKKYPQVAKIAMDLEGQVKGSGKHAAAMCISSDNLKDGKRTNLANRKKELISNWDKYDAEFMGIMKLDVLGLSALTILNYTRRLVAQNHGADIVYDQIPLDDSDTLSEASKGHTVGTFQIGSVGLRKFCKDLQIDCFEDIVHATALWRPGTLRTGMASEFVERKHGRSEIEYIHPILKEKTEETQGIILYQEQVMWLMYELAGLGWRTCDTVRKVISKSQGDEQFASFKQTFIDGCKEQNTLPEEEAGKLWDGLSAFGSYSFNKAHAVEYSLITYWEMYMKTHYSKEYMAASLTYLGADKKQELIEESRRLGVEIALPKLKHSDIEKWVTNPKEEIIYCPFLEIKGIGEKTAKQIVNLNSEGFYSGEGRKPNKTVIATLSKIKAFSDEDIKEEEENELSKYFDFSISKDPMRQFRKLYEMMKPYLGQIGEKDDELDLMFGHMVELRFGYRKNVKKSSEGSTGGAMLGGVYGTFKDEIDLAMIVFNGKLYERKKNKIEHCSENWILARCKRNFDTASLMLDCSDMWDEEDISTCNLEGVGLNLISPIKYRNRTVWVCNDCELREECTRPVANTTGGLNIMIIGEAPSAEDDRKSDCFTGRTGEKLWESLRIDNLNKDDFHLSNVVKCYPKETKKPQKKHIKACRRHLEMEIDRIKPPLILSFGNTGLKFFKNQDSGIMDASGTTEWNERFGCWICWCIHPASTLYDDSNDGLFEEGISNFVDKISYITDLYED